MTTTNTTATGTWTTTTMVIRDGSDLVLYVTITHDCGERYSFARRGEGVRAMANRPLAEQLAWIEEQPMGTPNTVALALARKLAG